MDGEAEDGREVDEGEADGGVVDDEEDSEIPRAEMITSAFSNWPNGLRSEASISMPLALASIRARSRMVTIS